MNRHLWQLAWPMILANLTVPLLGMVDTAILGHLSQPYYIGAAAVGGVIFNLLFWAFGFLRMGTTGLTSQAYGSGDLRQTALILYRSITLALLLGLFLILLQDPLFELAFLYMTPSAEVEHFARLYCDIRIYSAPATLCNFVILGWLLSIGKPRAVLLLSTLTNSVNILADYWFVVHYSMLTDGVALGSLLADYVGLVTGVFLLYRHVRPMSVGLKLTLMLNLNGYLNLLQVNRYIFVRTLALLFCFSFFYAQSARFDDVTLAANAILITLLMVFSYGQDGFANAAEVLCGRAVGNRNLADFYRASRTAAIFTLYTTAVFIAAVLLFDDLITGLLTSITSVAAQALSYWPWLILVSAIAAWNFLLDGIFIGTTKARAMQNTMLVSALIVFLPAWYLLTPWGNQGLWAAFALFQTSRSLSMAIMYRYYSKHSLWW